MFWDRPDEFIKCEPPVDHKGNKTLRDEVGHGCLKMGGQRYEDVEKAKVSTHPSSCPIVYSVNVFDYGMGAGEVRGAAGHRVPWRARVPAGWSSVRGAHRPLLRVDAALQCPTRLPGHGPLLSGPHGHGRRQTADAGRRRHLVGRRHRPTHRRGPHARGRLQLGARPLKRIFSSKTSRPICWPETGLGKRVTWST